jgi:glyoxylase-like metal-dependent hydrolase (beta-lactamase superfamily II)
MRHDARRALSTTGGAPYKPVAVAVAREGSMQEPERAGPPAAVVAAAEVPPLDRPVPLAPGIHWLRLPLPFALDHVNLWLCEDRDGWTLIDAGLGDARTLELYGRMAADWFGGRPLRRVLATHFHPDHLGAAGELVRCHDAELLMTRTEWLMGRMLALDDSAAFIDAGSRYDRRCGLDPELIELRRGRGNLYRRNVTLPPASFTPLAGGDRIELAGTSFEVIIGEGHAPEMVTLWSAERRLLIAADQLLPRITPVVGVWPTSVEPDPLGDFLGSLPRWRHLPADTLVLPSHGQPYRGLHARLDELAAHHEERLERTLALCRGPVTAYDVAHGLFPRAVREPAQIGFVLAETMAHLVALERRGRVRRELHGTAELWQPA